MPPRATGLTAGLGRCWRPLVPALLKSTSHLMYHLRVQDLLILICLTLPWGKKIFDLRLHCAWLLLRPEYWMRQPLGFFEDILSLLVVCRILCSRIKKPADYLYPFFIGRPTSLDLEGFQGKAYLAAPSDRPMTVFPIVSCSVLPQYLLMLAGFLYLSREQSCIPFLLCHMPVR